MPPSSVSMSNPHSSFKHFNSAKRTVADFSAFSTTRVLSRNADVVNAPANFVLSVSRVGIASLIQWLPQSSRGVVIAWRDNRFFRAEFASQRRWAFVCGASGEFAGVNRAGSHHLLLKVKNRTNQLFRSRRTARNVHIY